MSHSTNSETEWTIYWTQAPELWMVTQNSVSSTHNCVNESPVYGIRIPEAIVCFYFLSQPHKILKREVLLILLIPFLFWPDDDSSVARNRSILPTKLASYFPNYAKLDLGPKLIVMSVFDIATNYAKLDLGPKLLVISDFDTANSSWVFSIFETSTSKPIQYWYCPTIVV